MSIREKLNSWRLGSALYFLIQCLFLITIFFVCTEENVSKADLMIQGSISYWVFIGTGFYQFIILIPMIILFLLAKCRRTALALIVLSLLWMGIMIAMMNLDKG